jgi:hypothetical protein
MSHIIYHDCNFFKGQTAAGAVRKCKLYFYVCVFLIWPLLIGVGSKDTYSIHNERGIHSNFSNRVKKVFTW